VARELHRLPRDVDLVLGIPHSGLPAAWLVARALDRPCLELDAWLTSGATSGAPALRVLLVDDCVATGATMASATARIRERLPQANVVTVAIFGDVDAAAHADLVLEPCGVPRAFEWTLFREPLVGRSCYDLDGVLCPDPPADDDDDGARYLDFITTTPPLMIPSGRIRRIVTARLEKYRAPTEDWLHRRGIAFDELVMIDLPSAEERHRRGGLGLFKAEVYKGDPAAQLFIESNSQQARTIARRSGKPTFDYTARVMLGARTAAGGEPHHREARLWERVRRGVGWRLRRGVKRWRQGAAGTAVPPASWGPQAR
jgi:hypothetical protein